MKNSCKIDDAWMHLYKVILWCCFRFGGILLAFFFSYWFGFGLTPRDARLNRSQQCEESSLSDTLSWCCLVSTWEVGFRSKEGSPTQSILWASDSCSQVLVVPLCFQISLKLARSVRVKFISRKDSLVITTLRRLLCWTFVSFKPFNVIIVLAAPSSFLLTMHRSSFSVPQEQPAF